MEIYGDRHAREAALSQESEQDTAREFFERDPLETSAAAATAAAAAATTAAASATAATTATSRYVRCRSSNNDSSTRKVSRQIHTFFGNLAQSRESHRKPKVD